MCQDKWGSGQEQVWLHSLRACVGIRTAPENSATEMKKIIPNFKLKKKNFFVVNLGWEWGEVGGRFIILPHFYESTYFCLVAIIVFIYLFILLKIVTSFLKVSPKLAISVFIANDKFGPLCCSL